VVEKKLIYRVKVSLKQQRTLLHTPSRPSPDHKKLPGRQRKKRACASNRLGRRKGLEPSTTSPNGHPGTAISPKREGGEREGTGKGRKKKPIGETDENNRKREGGKKGVLHPSHLLWHYPWYKD